MPGRRDAVERRVMAIAVVVTAVFVIIVGQLWYLQVLEGGRFLDASDKNRVRIRPIAAPRGILFDRHGTPLVDNRLAVTLSLVPPELPRESASRDAVLGRVASLLRIPYQELQDAVARVQLDSFLPVRVRRGLTLGDVAKVEEWKLELPGVIAEVEPQRVYPTSRFAAHLLGYVREANDDQLRQGRYRRGEMVGQSGLERLLDDYLRGQDGGERIEVDAMGRPVRVIQQGEPEAGLQEGSITPADSTHCTGEFRLGNATFRDWKEGGHGTVDLKRAIMHSCNIYFYQAGLKVGVATLLRYASAFGFGASTGIELQGEKFGLVPRPARRGWPLGETVNLSIGQGPVLVTPTQVARFMAAVANGGVLWRPRIVQRIERPDGGLLYSDAGQVNGHVELSPLVWEFLRRSLWAAVNDGGTGAGARSAGLDIAGKTGTAQIIGKSKAALGQDHAWFAAFAPAKDPEVVVVVLAERGGKGGEVAAPIARQILSAIFFEKVAAIEIGG